MECHLFFIIFAAIKKPIAFKLNLRFKKAFFRSITQSKNDTV